MKQSKIVAVAVSILVLAIGAWVIIHSSNEEAVNERQDVVNGEKHENAPSSNSKFATLKGSAFDEAYLADMMAHHEGAVNMGEQALGASERPEIRELANEIVFTQSREMAQISEWQSEWGFDATMGAHGSHGGSANDMAGEMMNMSASLNGLSGDEFDKVFLEQMIIHHQQAVDMSEYADTNAERQELKDLARTVIETQEKEIDQMKQWLNEWDFKSIESSTGSPSHGTSH